MCDKTVKKYINAILIVLHIVLNYTVDRGHLSMLTEELPCFF